MQIGITSLLRGEVTEVHLIVEGIQYFFCPQCIDYKGHVFLSIYFEKSHADLRTGEAINYTNNMVKRYSIEPSH